MSRRPSCGLIIKGPCKNCDNRFVGCHSECLKYIDYRQKLDVYRQTEKTDKKVRADYGSVRKKKGKVYGRE